jgi:monofunctional biosynthetic peptidoglycan transglycosylase
MILVLGFSVYFGKLYSSLPDLKQLTFRQIHEIADRSVRKRIEDPNQLKSYSWIDLHEVHRDFLYAIVISEDTGFFDHEGIDFDAVMNSVAENLRKKKYESGASTISQQVVKNLFLTHEKSLTRKIKEWILTSRLERHFTKNQILEVYLNIAEFGPDLFGIRQASQHFFKKAPAQINAAEGAFIALMLPSPRKNYYSIFENQNLAKTKRKKLQRVLGEMLANELISSKQYHQYVRYDFYSHVSRTSRSP